MTEQQLQQALLLLTMQISSQPSADLYLKRGEVYRALGMDKQAFDDLRSAVLLDPSLANMFEGENTKK